MNPPLERVIVKNILKQLRARGGFWIKIHGSPLQIAGIPDIIGCEKGYFYGFEVKRTSGIPARPVQEYYLGQIRKAGGIAAVVSSVDEVLLYLQNRKTPQ